VDGRLLLGSAELWIESEEIAINFSVNPKDQIPFTAIGNQCNFPRKGESIGKPSGLEYGILE